MWLCGVVTKASDHFITGLMCLQHLMAVGSLSPFPSLSLSLPLPLSFSPSPSLFHLSSDVLHSASHSDTLCH